MGWQCSRFKSQIEKESWRTFRKRSRRTNCQLEVGSLRWCQGQSMAARLPTKAKEPEPPGQLVREWASGQQRSWKRSGSGHFLLTQWGPWNVTHTAPSVLAQRLPRWPSAHPSHWGVEEVSLWIHEEGIFFWMYRLSSCRLPQCLSFLLLLLYPTLLSPLPLFVSPPILVSPLPSLLWDGLIGQ